MGFRSQAVSRTGKALPPRFGVSEFEQLGALFEKTSMKSTVQKHGKGKIVQYVAM
jgi:hypothetical protein